ncbi:MAG: phosphate ABC transporter permease subunit PstC [Phycisphaerae bacterium]
MPRKQSSTNDRTDTAAAVGFDRPLLLTPGRDLAGYVGRGVGWSVLTAVAFTSVVAVLLIFVFIIKEAWPFLAGGRIAEMFVSKSWHPTHDPPDFGALSLFAGSAYATLGAMLIAGPVGVLAAVFLSDIVPFGVRQVLKPIVEILAAIPSVAYGFFALLVVAPWMQRNLGFSTGTNILNVTIMLSIMAIPTVVSIAEDALTAVGRNLREGAYAMGCTRAEMLVKVVIPAAHSGIVAAVILGMMRAVGETMLVWMASGNAAQIPHPWWDLSQSIRTLTATIAGEMGEAEKSGEHYRALFALGLILLAVTFGLNLVSEYFLGRAKRRQGTGG